jgi:hypothetical protein
VFEYRVGWSSSSNITFRGESDWFQYGGFAETVAEVEDELQRSTGTISEGLETFLEAAGLDWWLEVREAQE